MAKPDGDMNRKTSMFKSVCKLLWVLVHPKSLKHVLRLPHAIQYGWLPVGWKILKKIAYVLQDEVKNAHRNVAMGKGILIHFHALYVLGTCLMMQHCNNESESLHQVEDTVL